MLAEGFGGNDGCKIVSSESCHSPRFLARLPTVLFLLVAIRGTEDFVRVQVKPVDHLLGTISVLLVLFSTIMGRHGSQNCPPALV